MRKLASIVLVDDVIAHSNADALELAIIGGWQCCVKKGEFRKGDKALYCEIDSMLPIDRPDFAFLEERGGIKEVEGVRYSRIRTIKLRKELSQGLLIPVPSGVSNASIGADVTKHLGIIKYEKPEAGVSAGSDNIKTKTFMDKLIVAIRGKSSSVLKEWPQFIQKTDQERVQNKTVAYSLSVASEEEFEISYKLDGSSWTAFIHKEKDGSLRTGVCSRNYELQSHDIEWTETQQIRQYVADLLTFNRRFFKSWKLKLPEFRTGVKVAEDNFVKMFRQYQVDGYLKTFYQDYRRQIAIQGEMIGPSIQKNFEGNKELDLYIFNVYDIDKGQYLLPEEAKEIVRYLQMKYVPVFEERAKLLPTVKECLEQAEGPSAFKTGKYREGLVYKSLTRDFSFKSISNSYLLKNEE